MKWILTILAFTSCSLLIVGDYHSELLRTTYVNRTDEICKIFSDFEENGIKYEGVNVCEQHAIKMNLIEVMDFGNIYVNSKIKRGDFNGNEGFALTLDDLSSIDIPAIIECDVKDKYQGDVEIEGKALIFYITPYKEEEQLKFDRAEPTGEINERNNTVFMLTGVGIIKRYLENYQLNRTARRMVERWFDKATTDEQSGKKTCQHLSNIGFLNEKPGVPFFLINGEIFSSVEKNNKKQNRKKKKITKKTDEFYLRLTDSIEIKLIGVIKCEVKSSLQDIFEKYFTVTYKNGKKDIAPIPGPITIDGKKTFAIRASTYYQLQKQSPSNKSTEI